jgi:hypothetical protein
MTTGWSKISFRLAGGAQTGRRIFAPRMRAFLWILIIGGALAFAGGLGGCANVMPPSGGPKDTMAPRLLSVLPADSGLRVRPKKITLRFDEYVVVQDAATQLTLSPLLAIAPTATADLRKVDITIPDTLLQPNTTYRLSTGTSIRDLHEDNPAPAFSYTFSTGDYFDSLQLQGRVLMAATGKPDTGITVMLHEADAAGGDTAVLSRKPQYVVHADGAGNFQFSGLPRRNFSIYALGDKNGNLVFDGAGERIAFLDSMVTPVVIGEGNPLLLRSFEEPDTAVLVATPPVELARKTAAPTYRVDVDTADTRRRTASLTAPLNVQTSDFHIAQISPDRIFLTQDSGGTASEVPVTPAVESTDSSLLTLAAPWRPDVVYTLRLLKGFAKDSAGRELLPSRWTFRTKREEDYAVMQVNLPGKYRGKAFLLQVTRDGKDTIWNAPILDTVVRLSRLEPGAYSMLVVGDANENGKWDPGNLLLRRQPEEVYPFNRITTLKAGWDNVVDFIKD